MSYRYAVITALVFASCAQPATPSAAANPERGWEVMRHVRFAMFSAVDRRTYNLMLSCEGDTITLYHRIAPANGGADPQLRLTSGAVSVTLASTTYEDRPTPPPQTESASGPGEIALVVQADVRANAPVIAAFLNTGQLRARSGRQSLDASATAAERDAIAALIGSCRLPRPRAPDQPLQQRPAPNG